MASGSTTKTNQKKSLLYRGFTATGSLSATQYLPPSQFKVGINNGTPTISKTDLDSVIPISDGTTNDDGSNTMIGSGGGDNSTANTTTYKEGAGNTDDTAQNLIANGSYGQKVWEIADLSSAGNGIDSTKYVGLWLYIKDQTTLDKVVNSSANAVTIFMGNNSANYYYISIHTNNLIIGWQFITDSGIVSTMPKMGSPSGTLLWFRIQIVTGSASSTFIAGDIIFDLLRQWEASDTVKNLESGYPAIDLNALSMTTRGVLTATQANGFNIDGHGTFNEDTTPLIMSEDTTGGESKSRTDEFAFVAVDRFL